MGGSQPREGQFRWIDKYELIDVDNNDKVLKLMSRVGESEYIGKEVTSQGSQGILRMQRLIADKIVNPSPFLMRLKRAAVKDQQGLCNNSRTFYLVFEKPFQTLKEECISRKIKNARFSEDEVECILESCVKGIHYLKEMGESHRNISTSSIFLREDRTVLLGDPWVVGEGTLKGSLYGFTYPSPQKILFQNQLIHSYDYMLSDLFSLGVLLLEILTLQHMDVLYEKGFRRLRHIQVVQRVNQVRKQQLRANIKLLLDYNPAKRREILEVCDQKEALQGRFILHEKQQFKNNYITTQLQTSQVRTVKPKDEVHTIINKINQSHHHSDISMMTEPRGYNRIPPILPHESTLRPNYTQQNLANRFSHHPQPQIISTQHVRFTPNTANQIQTNFHSHLPFRMMHPHTTYHTHPQPHPQPHPLKQTSQLTHNIQAQQRVEEHFQDKIELSSIHHNSSRGSEELSNIQISEGRKDQVIKQVELYQVQAGQVKEEDIPCESRHLNSTIKQLSDQSPSKEQLEPQQQEVVYEMGTRYRGQMRKGMRQGFGTFYYVDGGYYEGEWKQNKMHGKGRLYYHPSRLIYEGSWVMDCFHGQGNLYNYQPTPFQHPYDYSNLTNVEECWEKYQGEFFYDKKHGRGKLTLANGQGYYGMFDNNEMSGQGKYYRLNGEIISGIWGNSILMERL